MNLSEMASCIALRQTTLRPGSSHQISLREETLASDPNPTVVGR